MGSVGSDQLTVKRKYKMRESIKLFAEAMERKLQRDDGKKKGWEACDIQYLSGGLWEELFELEDAIANMSIDSGGVSHVLEECTDVANFAMMIFCVLHDRAKMFKRGKRDI